MTVFREQEKAVFRHEWGAWSNENISGFGARIWNVLTVNPPPYEVLGMTGFEILTTNNQAVPTLGCF